MNQTKVLGTAALCALATHGVCGEPIYSCRGEISDKCSGWTFIPTAGTGGITYQASEGYGPAKGGQLLGPALPVNENAFRFYLLRFDARAAESGYWGIFFYDKEGKALVSDIYSSIYGGAEKRHYERVFYGRETATGFRPFVQSVRGVEIWDLTIQPVSAQEAAAECDRLYQTLPPLSSTPPLHRLHRLPKTVEAMKAGTPWRVVMLGDSIINDTFNSNFQSLLQRAWPKSDLRFICSVRGSTGCGFYQEPESFRAYVKNLRPDLLILGGISHGNDLEAIRRVIERTRKEIGCEMILMSGPLGKDWRAFDANHPDAALPEQVWTPDPFVEKQRRLAGEMQIEFMDLATAWHEYLGKSRQPHNGFQRDDVHGDDRGKQIVGRMIEACFKP